MQDVFKKATSHPSFGLYGKYSCWANALYGPDYESHKADWDITIVAILMRYVPLKDWDTLQEQYFHHLKDYPEGIAKPDTIHLIWHLSSPMRKLFFTAFPFQLTNTVVDCLDRHPLFAYELKWLMKNTAPRKRNAAVECLKCISPGVLAFVDLSGLQYTICRSEGEQYAALLHLDHPLFDYYAEHYFPQEKDHTIFQRHATNRPFHQDTMSTWDATIKDQYDALLTIEQEIFATVDLHNVGLILFSRLTPDQIKGLMIPLSNHPTHIFLPEFFKDFRPKSSVSPDAFNQLKELFDKLGNPTFRTLIRSLSDDVRKKFVEQIITWI